MDKNHKIGPSLCCVLPNKVSLLRKILGQVVQIKLDADKNKG